MFLDRCHIIAVTSATAVAVPVGLGLGIVPNAVEYLRSNSWAVRLRLPMDDYLVPVVMHLPGDSALGLAKEAMVEPASSG